MIISFFCIQLTKTSTSTTLGLPPNTVYEGVLSSDFTYLSTHQLPSDLVGQLRIAQFLNTTTKNLYCNKSEPNGLVPEATRPQTLENLRALYGRLEIALADHMSSKRFQTHSQASPLTIYSGYSAPSSCCQRSPPRFCFLPHTWCRSNHRARSSLQCCLRVPTIGHEPRNFHWCSVWSLQQLHCPNHHLFHLFFGKDLQ